MLLKGVTLYLASLYAPAIGNIMDNKYPKIPKLEKLIFQATITGATPNDIKSDKESNSFPKSLTTLKCLAALPSNLSVNAATSISKEALIKALIDFLLSAWVDKIIATTPKDKLISVKTFGITFL